MRLMRFCTKICSLPTNDVRSSLDSMESARPRGKISRATWLEDRNCDFGAKKASYIIRAKRVNRLLLSMHCF